MGLTQRQCVFVVINKISFITMNMHYLYVSPISCIGYLLVICYL